jgi:hypothetical protein
MDDLEKALGDIYRIRNQVARSTEFRGYGPATLLATGAFAIVAACLQSRLLPNPTAQFSGYLQIWITTAALSIAVAGAQVITRSRRMHSSLSNQMIREAVAQFLPALGAGLLTTFIVARFAASADWLLPALWQIFFGVGIFASCRVLPRLMAVPAAWYLLAGAAAIAGGPAHALSPWTMGIGFGAGQTIVAAVLLLKTQGASHEE